MVIEFSVTNFRSFRDEQRFSLVAAAADKSLPDNLSKPAGFKQRLLRSAVIYGPNASGKSNLIMAMGYLQLLILHAAQRPPTPGQRMIDLPLLKPFALESASLIAPTRFEIHFLHDHVRYQYGIALDRRAIQEEWLIAYPKGQPQTWFERRLRVRDERVPSHSGIREQRRLFDDPDLDRFTQNDADAYTWYFGPRLSGEKQRLAALTRVDVPFLSTAATFGNPQLRHVFGWFALRLFVVNPWGRPDLVSDTARHTLNNPELRTIVRDLLAYADIGIHDFRVQEIPVKDDPQLHDMPEPLLHAMDGLDLHRVDLRLRHAAPNLPEGAVEFERDDESLGTLRFFGLAGPLVEALLSGATLFVDEFDDSLHPHLVRRLIDLFHTASTNPNLAQLVINTHDATLLDGLVFRRDQIWLTEKQPDGATTLIPLSDYHPRKDDSLMRGYLYGRYGGVPMLDRVPMITIPKHRTSSTSQHVNPQEADADNAEAP